MNHLNHLNQLTEPMLAVTRLLEEESKKANNSFA
jgi:hypothetical protein